MRRKGEQREQRAGQLTGRRVEMVREMRGVKARKAVTRADSEHQDHRRATNGKLTGGTDTGHRDRGVSVALLPDASPHPTGRLQKPMGRYR